LKVFFFVPPFLESGPGLFIAELLNAVALALSWSSRALRLLVAPLSTLIVLAFNSWFLVLLAVRMWLNSIFGGFVDFLRDDSIETTLWDGDNTVLLRPESCAVTKSLGTLKALRVPSD